MILKKSKVVPLITMKYISRNKLNKLDWLIHQDVCARLTLSQLPSMVSLNCNLLNLATKSVLKSLVPPLAATVNRGGNLETLGFQSNLFFRQRA